MMRRLISAGILALAVTAVDIPSPMTMAQVATAQAPAKPAAQAVQPAQATVPVRTVVLFSSGVGYFEHGGLISGNASTELRFKTTQINDILKSLVLQDTGGGSVSNIVYPSQDPLAKTLRSFQVDLSNNPPLADLLNQLRGARVKLNAGAESFGGTILGLEKKPKAVEKGSIEVWQINLLAGAGVLRSLALDQIDRIELEDAALQEELNKALLALSQARDQDKKPVTIHFAGQGERTVRLAYVVETPIWKTSYRLVLGEKPALQGWAIVENQTDNDWKDVQLSLVSGRPISFIQDLYQPLYVPRPVVQPELYANLKPQTYDAGTEKKAEEKPKEKDEKKLTEALPQAGKPLAEPMRRAVRLGALDERDAREILAQSSAGELRDKPIDIMKSVGNAEQAKQLGELFEYKIGALSLPRQRSAMIPIITDPIEVEKVSIYNASILPRNPLNGARVKNTTSKHLLQGPISVFEAGSYAGDARIESLPPGQERLISYGIDLQVLVNSTKNIQTISIQSGKIVKGTLQLQRKHVYSQDYLAENKGDKDRTLVVEHAFRRGWTLIEPEKPAETTETLYRFRQTVPAGKSITLTVKEQMVQEERIAILPMDYGTLDVFSKSEQISPKVKEALAKAAAMKQKLTDLEREINQRRLEINQMSQDQARIRENLKAAPERSELATRLLAKLDETEKQIEQTQAKMKDHQQSLEQARRDLEDYVSKLEVSE